MRSFGLILRLRSASGDEHSLRAGEQLVLAWVAIARVEEGKIEETDETARREIPPPAKMQQQNTNQRHSDRRGEFCGCVKYCGCQASFFPRKPIADRFCICRERGGFTYPQEQSRRKEAADSGGDRCGEGSYTPENRTDAAHAAQPKPIHQETGGHLGQSICPTVSAQQITKRNCGYDGRTVEGIL